MKRNTVFSLIALASIIVLSTCTQASFTATAPNLSSLDVTRYSSFVILSTQSDTRATTVTSANQARLQGIRSSDGGFEEIPFISDTGDVWYPTSVEKVSNKYLWIVLNSDYGQIKNVVIEKSTNLVFDIDASIQSYLDAEGIDLSSSSLLPIPDQTIRYSSIYLVGDLFVVGIVNGTIFRVSISNGTVTPVNNYQYDNQFDVFYASHSGHVIAGGWVEDSYIVKLFPASGKTPFLMINPNPTPTSSMEGSSLLRYSPYNHLSSPEVDYIINFQSGAKFTLSESGWGFSQVSQPNATGRLILDRRTTSSTNLLENCALFASRAFTYVDYIDYTTGTSSSNPKIIEYFIENGEFGFKEYSAPVIQSNSGTACADGKFAYDLSMQSLHSYDLESQTDTVVTASPINSWELVAGGILYCQYETAVKVVTYQYDFATSTTKKLFDSEVQPVSLVRF